MLSALSKIIGRIKGKSALMILDRLQAEKQHWPGRVNIKPPAGLVVRDFLMTKKSVNGNKRITCPFFVNGFHCK